MTSLEPAPADDPCEVADAWRRELERRGRVALSGSTPGTEWPAVRDALRDELASE